MEVPFNEQSTDLESAISSASGSCSRTEWRRRVAFPGQMRHLTSRSSIQMNSTSDRREDAHHVSHGASEKVPNTAGPVPECDTTEP